MKLKHACVDAGQYGVNVSPEEYHASGIRMLRTSDLAGDQITPPEAGVFLEGPIPAAQLVEKDDILLSRAGTIGRAYLVPESGAGSTFAGFLVRFRPKAGVDPRFLHYALLAKPTQEQISAEAVTSTIQNFNADRYANLSIPDRSSDEQRRIADFLDDRVARIDHIISARQRQIRLLHGALASEVAVLVASDGRGWLTGSLRRFARSCDSVRIPLSSEERANRQGEYPYFGASGVIDHIDDYRFEGPKVLVSEDGANLLQRSTAIAFVADGQYWVNNHAHILEPFDGAHDFWAARIEALDVSPWVTGSAQPKLTIDATMALPVSAPAEIETRLTLGRRAVAARAFAQNRIWALEAGCTLLQEYKQSLITAAVTGELDVTTAGSGIPG